MGIDAALTKAQDMTKDGWTIDLERGAIMRGQVKDAVHELSLSGFEAQTIPVAKWRGEEVVMVTFKPSVKPPPASPSTPPKAVQSPQSQRITGDDEASAYKRLWKTDTDDNGFLMSEDHATCFIKNNAHPTINAGLQRIINDRQDCLYTVEINNATLHDLNAQMRVHTKSVSFLGGKLKVDITFFRKALNVFPSVPLRIFASENQPLVIKDPDGNALVIAPLAEDPNAPAQSVEFETIKVARRDRP